MTKRLRGIVSLLLVFVLCLGMVPGVSAAEVEIPHNSAETQPTEAETVDIPTPTEENMETSQAPPETDAEIPPENAITSTGPGMLMTAAADDYGIMTAASTQSGIMLFDFADNGDYTSRLNSQLSVAYKPNGSGTTRTAYIKNLGWHFARYGNVPYADDPLYCIEPWRNYAASTSGNSVDRDVTLSGSGSSTGSNVWYAMPSARREAIGLILLYSDMMWDDSISVFNVRRDSNPNVPLRVATQFLIYEIVCGLRNPSTFVLNSTNECGTAGDIFYNAGVAAISNFAPNYNTLVSYVQSALKRPSFTGSSSSNAPTITLTGDETSVYDSNGVLSEWSFSDGNGAEFYKSGNYLYIYQTGTISESTVFKATKYVPSAANSTYNIWYMSGSSYQTTISLASASYGNLNAYFRLDPPDLGNLNLTKTTEDGKNLANWRFGIYSNSACTSLVAGPYTTNSSGKISVTGLSAGTYYVKELGHTDSSINALYYCSSTNPQKVTITAGSTASVSFTNKLNTGNLSLTKTTEDGKNLSGWQFSIYSNSACTSLVSGPHTTDSSGKISVTGLKPGTYYVKEIGHTTSSVAAQYYCASTNPQKVTITANSTASVSFTNKLNTGSLSLTKTTEDGKNLEGWKFSIYSDAACSSLVSGPHTTNSSGKISVTGLLPGTYYVKEIGHTDSAIGALYTCASTNPQKVTLTAGGTVSVSFVNNLHKGSLKLVKTTNTGANLSGWQIGVYTDSACTKGVSGSPFTTGADGTVTVSNLVPGTYYAKEIAVSDPYWVCDSSVETVQVAMNQTATVSFSNTHYGDLRVTKTAVNGSAQGWSFQILDANKDLVDTIKTDADGYAYSGKLAPGKYYVREVHDRDETYWEYDANVEQQVTITAGSRAEVSYTNTQYGRIQFTKTTNTGNQLGGWVFRVTDSNYEVVGEYTTDETGYAITEKLAPGRYLVQELSNGDDYWNIDVMLHDVTVVAGETVEDPWYNREQGLGWFHKSTNTGESLKGWHITIYEDEACTQEIRTMITNEDGRTGYYMDPGIYYAKETGDEYGRFEDEYWLVDESVQEFEIKPHEDTEIHFTNVQYGKLKIIKTMYSHGSAAGWQFKVTDANGKEIDGSPFTTGEDGVIQTTNILPGTYTVEEILPEGSIYQPMGENPQTVTVTQGKIAEVSFTNCLRPGKIELKKIDITGSPLSGATFYLEWSEDGSLWWPVEYSDSDSPEEGCCSNPDIQNGLLTTGEDGILVWENLYPGLQYRLTETEAPDGYNLLNKPAYEGELPTDDLTVEVRVINTRIFTMPETGVSTGMVLKVLSLLAAIGCLGVIVYRKRKE